MSEYPQVIHGLLRSVHGKIVHLLSLPFRKIGLTPPQAFTLHEIFRAGDGVSVGEVCRALNTPLSNTTNICMRLESLGLIDRRRDEADRRKVMLFLTKKGRVAVEGSIEIYGRLNLAMDEGLDEETRKNIVRDLGVLDGWLNEYTSKEKEC